MNTKLFFTTQSVLGFLFAFSMIFMSQQMTERYMMDVSWENPATKLIRQGMAALLLGIAIGSWSARKAAPSTGLNAFLLSSFAGNFILAVFHVNAILGGVEKSFAWLTAGICFTLSIWSYLLYRKIDKETRTQ